MMRNYFASAIGNFWRSRFYSGLTILGVVAGFAAAMIVGLYVRDEYSFERFIVGYQQAYWLEMDAVAPGQKPAVSNSSRSTAAAELKLTFPDVEYSARLARRGMWVGRGEAKFHERIAWVDPDFFTVLPYPVLAGDPVRALNDPNGVIVTRKLARKYFGADAAIGKTLMIQAVGGDGPLSSPHPMVVRAVLRDIPSETHLEPFNLFASGKAAWSPLTAFDREPSSTNVDVWTYLKLRTGASPEQLRAALPTFARRHFAGPIGWRLRLEPLRNLHFARGAQAADAGIAVIGILIIAIAAINFITLMTARATRRAVEVGIRKAFGARRLDLMIQFMGEAVIYALVAMLISVAVVELTLPSVDAFLQRTIAFDYLNDPPLAAAILGTAVLMGLVAGLYPAAVLSSFRPAIALKGGDGLAAGSLGVRQALVVVQFAILVGLIIVAVTVYRQTSFALQNLALLKEDQVLNIGSSCDPAFKNELAALPGVDAVACVSEQAVGEFPLTTSVRDPVKGNVGIDIAPIDVGFFQMVGLKPLAGRLFAADRGEDMILFSLGAGPESQPSVVLNESGVRRLGFTSAQDAVGRRIDWGRWSAASPGASLPPLRSSRVIGVVKDFTLGSIQTRIEPMMYFVDPKATDTIALKFEARRLPETLRAIDDLWRNTGHTRPIYRSFLGQYIRGNYRDTEVQGAIVASCAGLAIVIACLGLFALAAFTAERRTKEIGVRKAMGGSSFDVVRLLLWQFTKPVLWANLMAWPLAFLAADRWLQGFAYRVNLPPWLFISASAVAVLIAWMTAGGQAWIAACTKPAEALRHE